MTWRMVYLFFIWFWKIFKLRCLGSIVLNNWYVFIIIYSIFWFVLSLRKLFIILINLLINLCVNFCLRNLHIWKSRGIWIWTKLKRKGGSKGFDQGTTIFRILFWNNGGWILPGLPGFGNAFWQTVGNGQSNSRVGRLNR